MMYFEIAAGFAVLLFGGDVLVRGAVAMAERFGVSPLVIGLTVVACGTSAPELVICIDAVLSGVPSIAIGNVVGSNIANVLLVLGLPALIAPIACNPEGMRRNGALMVATSLLFAAFALGGTVVRWQGGALLVLLLAFLVFSYLNSVPRRVRQGAYGHEFEAIETVPKSGLVSLAFVVAGSVGLVIGSGWLIDGAVGVARSWGVSEAVIGLTLIAIGTSLPELAASLAGALRGHGDVAVGNVLGSNMFNILGIMGAAALVAPIPVPAEILGFDLWVMLGVAVVLGAFALRGGSIGRAVGLVFILSYAAYLTAQFQGLSGIEPGLG